MLNSEHNEAYIATGQKSEAKKLPKAEADAKRLTDWMCANFFDVRTFDLYRVRRTPPAQAGSWYKLLAGQHLPAGGN